MIDIRCDAREPLTFAPDDANRCQLWAGHDGVHALMFCAAGARHVRTWRAGDPTSLADDAVSPQHLSWVRGMPQPAWYSELPD